MNNITTITLIAIAILITGCSTEPKDFRTAQEKPNSAIQSPQAAPVAPLRAIVAVLARCKLDSTEAQRKYTQTLVEKIYAKLVADTTITTLPRGGTDDSVSGWHVPGFITPDELNKAVDRLPRECNIVIIVGPHPGNTGWFPTSITLRSDLRGMQEAFGSPKSDDAPTSEIVDNVFELVRRDIDTVLAHSK